MIQTGEVRQDMVRALSETLEYVLNKKKDKAEPYFILIYCKLESENVGITKVIVLNEQPPKMIGTTCYRIDNRQGTKQLLWLLPLDIPIPGQVEITGQEQKIIESSRDMPIYWN